LTSGNLAQVRSDLLRRVVFRGSLVVRIRTSVHASDAVTRDAVSARLSHDSTFEMVPTPEADVVVMVTGQFGHADLAQLRAYAARPLVLVAAAIPDEMLMPAVDCGLVILLPRDKSGYDAIARAIQAAHEGHAWLPSTLLRSVLDRIGTTTPTPRANGTGFTDNEITVLRLLSAGLQTDEIATEIHRSERTVKQMITAIIRRYRLRNRTHAVAFAISCGVV
jgi:DNA-binding NarL/FixJ family response regulator